MKKIPVNILRAGLVFTEPVFIDDDNLLVPAGVAIREKDIKQLAEWDITEVFTNGRASVTMPQRAAPEGPPPAAGRGESYRGYLDLIRRMDSVFADIGAGQKVDIHSVDSIAADLFQGVLAERDIMMGYILGGDVKDLDTAKNSVNTAILSALIAGELKFTHYRILQIVTGALLHDAGMLKIPREIVAKRGGLSAEDLKAMHDHPLHSYQIAVKELGYPGEVGDIVWQHHENWDGQGYPRHLSGANIDTGARIVSVADAFEAMVSQKPYRNPLVGNQAIKNLLSDNSSRFDPEILKIFIRVMGIYPIGSAVLLNNGIKGLVIEARPDSPLRPKIRGETGQIIDLLTEKGLFITKALDPKEIALPKKS
ncbi:hypothetical protein AGMMS49928_18370 [Spirochaetia bacterium]|nr:hypothetical protein AGMMS49928_18370 [Spirochaetia bacterium]